MKRSPLLPKRKPVKDKRASRWRSPAHTSFVRSFCCAMCGSATNIEAAHVRMGSGAGMGQKPDDWRTVPLCAGPKSNAAEQLGCHDRQHIIGERTFWDQYEKEVGQTVEELLTALCKASPKRPQIEQEKRDRETSKWPGRIAWEKKQSG